MSLLKDFVMSAPRKIVQKNEYFLHYEGFLIGLV